MAKKRKPRQVVSISVPDELRVRMAKRNKDGVNWSAVACAAFEAKLGELVSKQEVRDMSDVVERLRASKLAAESEDYQDGQPDGIEWAKHQAEAPELQRLAVTREKWNDQEWYLTFNSDTAAFSAMEVFVFLIQPDNDGDRGAARDFWDFVLGPPEKSHHNLSGEWVRGFADGALSVWSEVKDQL